MSAFGVVWLDLQLSRRSQLIGQAKMKQFVTGQKLDSSPPTTSIEDTMERGLEYALKYSTTEHAAEQPVQNIEEVLACPDPSAVLSANLAVAALCHIPFESLDVPFESLDVSSANPTTAAPSQISLDSLDASYSVEQSDRIRAEIEAALELEQLHKDNYNHHNPYPPTPELSTLEPIMEEEDDELESGPYNFMTDMEAVQQELAEVLLRFQSNPAGKLWESEGSNAPPLEAPLRPRGPRVLKDMPSLPEIPALPEVYDDDYEFHTHSVGSDDDDDDMGFSDMDSPATSVSDTYGDDDVCEHPLDKELRRPQMLHVDSGLGMEFDDDNEDEEEDVAVTVETSTLAAHGISSVVVKSECDLVSVEAETSAFSVHKINLRTTPRRPQKSKRAPRKNNGWKRVPKKARLSASSKKRFLSRAVW